MKELTKRQREFCDAYARYGGNRALICDALGIRPAGFKAMMTQDVVKEYLACSMQRARDSIVAALPHITQTLLDMYNDPACDPKIRMEIAKQFMDRGNLIADRSLNVNVSVNTSIADRARQILAQRQTITIDTTATPVSMRVEDDTPQLSSIKLVPATTPCTPAADIAGKENATEGTQEQGAEGAVLT